MRRIGYKNNLGQKQTETDTEITTTALVILWDYLYGWTSVNCTDDLRRQPFQDIKIISLYLVYNIKPEWLTSIKYIRMLIILGGCICFCHNSFVCSVMGNYWMFMDRLKSLGFFKILGGNKISSKNTLMY